MSGFQNQTNRTRVQKMTEILDLIEKSAISNKAPVDEIREMLQPLLERLDLDQQSPSEILEEVLLEKRVVTEIRDGNVAGAMALQEGGFPNPGTHLAVNTIRNLAEKADLKDLTIALAIYLDRINEALGPRLET